MDTNRLKLSCDICKNNFVLAYPTATEDEVLLIREWVTIGENNTQLYISYFKCPTCGKKYISIVDNHKTLDLKQRMEEIAKQYSTTSTFKKQERNIIEMKQLQESVKRITQSIYRKYQGSFYQTEDGKEQLDFSLPKFE